MIDDIRYIPPPEAYEGATQLLPRTITTIPPRHSLVQRIWFRLTYLDQQLTAPLVQAVTFLFIVLCTMFVWIVVPNPDVALFLAGCLVLVAVMHAVNISRTR